MTTSRAAQQADVQELSTFARRLTYLRVAAGMSQEDLADRAGIAVRTLRRLEAASGRRPQPRTGDQLAAALGLDENQTRWLLDPAAPEDRPVSGVPAPAASRSALIGREDDLAAAAALLADPAMRMLTLTGPGGVGKTRLATELLRLAGPLRPTAFVPADVLTDPASLLPAMARALHVPPQHGDPVGAIARAVAGAPWLLVIDNLEHLLPAAPDLGRLLAATPGLTFLATSREAVRIAEEQVFAVEPLDTLDEHSPAVDLFLLRARQTDARFAPTPRQVQDIRAICQRLSGMPLAIELAAAQMDSLTPEHLLDLFDRTGLDALAPGRRDGPDRFASMAAAVRWSWDRLDPLDQRVLRTLAIFAGGFDAAAAGRVLAGIDAEAPIPESATAAALGRLARKNLIAPMTSVPSDPAPRFTLLEPIRLFAIERLRASGEEPAARIAHARWVTDFCEDLRVTGCATREFGLMLNRLEREYANARAALDWAEAVREYELAGGIVNALQYGWYFRDQTGEGLRVFERLVPHAAALPPRIRFLVFYNALELLARIRDGKRLAAVAEIALGVALEQDDDLTAALALLYRSQGIEDDPAAAMDLARQAREVLGPGRDCDAPPFLHAWSAVRDGIELHRLGRLAEAREQLERGLAMKWEHAILPGIVAPLAHLSRVEEDLGLPRQGMRSLLQAMNLAVTIGDPWLTLHAGTWLAEMLRRRGGAAGSALAGELERALDGSHAGRSRTHAPNAASPATLPDLLAAVEALLPEIAETAPPAADPRYAGMSLE